MHFIEDQKIMLHDLNIHVSLPTDDLAQRIADALADDEEEDVTWGGQFKK